VETEAIIEEEVQKPNNGLDELNLAEFPLCALSHRLEPGTKTLQFVDAIWDEHCGATVTRKLTITGSDAYGLPTALDDEVLLGLIQLSKCQGFNDRRVSFSRYRLLDVLGWRKDTKNYRRIEESLNRWIGVTLYYQNAWRDKSRRRWVDEKFHVLDNVWLRRRTNARMQDDSAPESAFIWNEVIFRSFKSGNVKSIDFELWKSLESAAAKRMYRFLDKRFYLRKQWEFNLQEFAWEHIGLSRNHDTAGLKRLLFGGVEELEHAGFLKAAPKEARFRRSGAGVWSVVFERAQPKPVTVQLEAAPENPLVIALVQRGVALSTARDTVASHPAEAITRQIEIFDWKMSHKNGNPIRRPPGYLVSAIRGQYPSPTDFVSSAEKKRVEQPNAQVGAEGKLKLASQLEREKQREADNGAALDAFWANLTGDKRSLLEREALGNASPFYRKQIESGGSLGACAKIAVLRDYAAKMLAAAGQCS